MREAGEEFDVVAVADPAHRFRLKPTLLYGRWAPGARRPQCRSWSVWSYALADDADVRATPLEPVIGHERPDRFLLTFGSGPSAVAVEVHLATAVAHRRRAA